MLKGIGHIVCFLINNESLFFVRPQYHWGSDLIDHSTTEAVTSYETLIDKFRCNFLQLDVSAK